MKRQLERKATMLANMQEWLPNWHLYGQGVLRGRLKVGDVLTGMVGRHIHVLRKASGADPSDVDRALRKLYVSWRGITYVSPTADLPPPGARHREIERRDNAFASQFAPRPTHFGSDDEHDDDATAEVVLFPDEALLLDTVRLLRVARVGQAATTQAIARNTKAEQQAEAARDERHLASRPGALGIKAPQESPRDAQPVDDLPFPPTIGTALIDRLAADAAQYVVRRVTIRSHRADLVLFPHLQVRH